MIELKAIFDLLVVRFSSCVLSFIGGYDIIVLYTSGASSAVGEMWLNEDGIIISSYGNGVKLIDFASPSFFDDLVAICSGIIGW